ncbi:DUF1127 domain-containing protein [Leisingera methylohalidivorans]|uniref:YjiS-like domain-containing protein n=1 Tax=Leisingera methylohalidivorans DSM 14336 TaxID=999552 RepID=V9VRL7_9RHOB|nr:DUF1127 domain-containing protein [Leisingera methylohalidivorans]AHD00329.1 hypothetical protein METH_05940 [Leisingera methylohalidivorans DSM 14336]
MTLATSSCTTPCSAAKPPLTLAARLRLHLSAWRQRRQLAKLDARALDDIGLTPSEADAEARRGFWSAPDHWTR